LRSLRANGCKRMVSGTTSPTRKPVGTDVFVAWLPKLRQISVCSVEVRDKAVSVYAAEGHHDKTAQSAIFEPFNLSDIISS
ncbi:MAG: hypothetical protein WAK63_09740, partial [Xanthobacteraceae bacterium]